jgi:flagellar protein FliO/FliZ
MPNVQGNLENQPYIPSDAVTTASSASFSWWGLMGTIILFILILSIALGVIRRMNRSTARGMSAPWARILDRQILSGQQSLYLVEIAGKLQVLGGTDHHLVKIDEINDPDLAAEILDEIANRPVERIEGFFSGIANHTFLAKRRKVKDSFSTELERLLEEVER